MLILDTERLVLREITPADAPFMLALLNDADFLRNVGDRGARTVDDARAYIARGPMASYERCGHGLYLVVVKATGEPAGICGLLKRDTLVDVDVGFAFLPAFRRRGYATESARGVLEYGSDVLGLRRIVAIVQPGNAASIRVLETIGLTCERTIPATAGDHEVLLYAREFPAVQTGARFTSS